MWKFAVLLICLSRYCSASPVGLKRIMPIVQQRNEAVPLAEIEPVANEDPNEMMIMSSLSLPSNATSIRADITDGFSCENRTYGYYADVDNDCQIFHVCLPVTYADGKENTFRWSFICPEDTIFSQDSFTCMRPDDMTITCEESHQYYELNRNFGVIDSSADKEDNSEAAAETAENNETILEAVEESAPAKPLVGDEGDKVIGQSKPIDVQKPTRRKPSISYATQKKPANSYHLRKVPQVHVQPQMSESPAIEVLEAFTENIKPVEEEKIKPAIKKVSRRPLPVASNSFKDGIQGSKPASVVATRTEFFNQMRKRPAIINKKPVEELEEDRQKEQHKIESQLQNFSPVASDMPISNSDTQEADTEVEASENNHTFVKPEESKKIAQSIGSTYAAEEPVKVLEAFEEIPAVISEVVETPNAEEEETKKEDILTVVNVGDVEKSNFADEPQITEEVQSAEEVQTAEEIKETQVAQETRKTSEEMQTAEGATDIEETQTADETETTQETQAVEETPEIQPLLRTSAEQTHNVDESVIAESIAQQLQAAEETEIGEESKVAEEIQNAQETQIGKGTQILEEAQDAEKTRIAEEPHILMETKIAEELQAVKETLALEDTETADENQPISEVQQSLRTSAEDMLNSEKIHFAEESPIVEVQVVEKIPAPEQTAAVEITQSSQETQEVKDVPNEAQTVVKILAGEEEQNIEESKESEYIPGQEAEMHTPDEITLTAEEPQPVVHNVGENKILEEAGSSEDSKPVEENTESEQVPATIDSALANFENVAEPAIFEENSEENINVDPVHTIEQMESEKPAEAPESMQATEEMSHPDAIVQQMYEDIDMDKKSVGGFKPVDPVMAHEAEQLIVDFINTLRRNDFTNETPGMHMEQNIDAASEQTYSHEDVADEQEAAKVENNENSQEENGLIQEEEDKDETQGEMAETKADTIEDNGEEMQDIHASEETKQESNAVVEENKDINEFDALKSLESEEASAEIMNLPKEMYQIPVQVITTPIEQLPLKEEQSLESEMEADEITANAEEKVQEESPVMSKDGYKPLSIDDIVELVKERLDHMPKTEMESPMQLEEVLSEAQKDKVAEEEMEAPSSVPIEDQQHTGVSEEEIVMPIYQRTGQPIQVDAGVKTNDATDAKEKTKRSYRSHSMLTPILDPRKRRFLFKADLS